MNKRSKKSVFIGILLLPILTSLFIIDRAICTFLFWIVTPAYRDFMTDWKQFMLSMYRIVFISALYTVFLLIKQIL